MFFVVSLERFRSIVAATLGWSQMRKIQIERDRKNSPGAGQPGGRRVGGWLDLTGAWFLRI